jgi:hypothetical protein
MLEGHKSKGQKSTCVKRWCTHHGLSWQARFKAAEISRRCTAVACGRGWLGWWCTQMHILGVHECAAGSRVGHRFEHSTRVTPCCCCCCMRCCRQALALSSSAARCTADAGCLNPLSLLLLLLPCSHCCHANPASCAALEESPAEELSIWQHRFQRQPYI